MASEQKQNSKPPEKESSSKLSMPGNPQFNAWHTQKRRKKRKEAAES